MNYRVQEVQKKLYSIPRAGWVKRGVSNPENVGQHTDELVILARKWEKDLEINDIETLCTMLQIHDWPEILHGDELTYHLEGEAYRKAKENKYQNERKAMQLLCTPLKEVGERLFELWLRFEEQKDHDAQIGHQIDKIQAVIKSLEYQKQNQLVSAVEFVNEVRKREQIKHPFLIEMLANIEKDAI